VTGDVAQMWRTPGEGERIVQDGFEAPVDEQALNLVQLGMDPVTAQWSPRPRGPRWAGVCWRCTDRLRSLNWSNGEGCWRNQEPVGGLAW
jgi:hypothetical protein